jgi:hypothetical protein
MRVRLASNWQYLYILTLPGRTLAEKRAGLVGPAIDYMKKLDEIGNTITTDKVGGVKCGGWVDVETEHVFEDACNTAELRLDYRMIDAVDFSPEFDGIDGYEKEVARQYAVKWPGCELQPILRRRMATGQIVNFTP